MKPPIIAGACLTFASGFLMKAFYIQFALNKPSLAVNSRRSLRHVSSDDSRVTQPSVFLVVQDGRSVPSVLNARKTYRQAPAVSIWQVERADVLQRAPVALVRMCGKPFASFGTTMVHSRRCQRNKINRHTPWVTPKRTLMCPSGSMGPQRKRSGRR